MNYFMHFVGSVAESLGKNAVFTETNAGARAFKLGGPNLKVGRPKFFIDFSPGKTCRA